MAIVMVSSSYVLHQYESCFWSSSVQCRYQSVVSVIYVTPVSMCCFRHHLCYTSISVLFPSPSVLHQYQCVICVIICVTPVLFPSPSVLHQYQCVVSVIICVSSVSVCWFRHQLCYVGVTVLFPSSVLHQYQRVVSTVIYVPSVSACCFHHHLCYVSIGVLFPSSCMLRQYRHDVSVIIYVTSVSACCFRHHLICVTSVLRCVPLGTKGCWCNVLLCYTFHGRPCDFRNGVIKLSCRPILY